jgi:hypothetical protein
MAKTSDSIDTKWKREESKKKTYTKGVKRGDGKKRGSIKIEISKEKTKPKKERRSPLFHLGIQRNKVSSSF